MKISNKKAELERQIAKIEKELRSIENSAAFKKEKAVIRALNYVMKKHGCSEDDLTLAILSCIALIQATVRSAATFSSLFPFPDIKSTCWFSLHITRQKC